MQRVRRLCRMRIANFVKSHTIFNVEDIVPSLGSVLGTHQSLLVTLGTISTLLDLALQNFHPAAIAGMIVNW